MATRRSPASWKAGEGRGPALFVVRAGQGSGGTAAGADAVAAHFPRSASPIGAAPRLSFQRPRFQHLGRGQRLWVDLGRIAVDEDEVRPFARLEAADAGLGEAGVSGIARESGKRGFEADALLRPPAARRLACHVLPADCRRQAGERVRAFDREVGAEGERGPRLRNGPPGIGALEARRVEALFGHQPIAGLVGRLHRGDDPRLGDARDVGGVDHLDMLDPPAALRPPFARHLLEDGDYLFVGGVANCMDRELVPAG